MMTFYNWSNEDQAKHIRLTSKMAQIRLNNPLKYMHCFSYKALKEQVADLYKKYQIKG